MEAGTDILRILLAAGGIGLVIFVHELGHYIAARMTGVRVETFSLGFGPRLIGWKHGPTTYQLALLPLGGYCRMAGEEPGSDGPPRPDELQAKSVGQRFFVYSGGVLANLAFGLAVFPIVFRVGVPFVHPTIGETEPGSPAWHAGIPAGSEVVSVNGNPVFDFYHIPVEAALGPALATIVVRDPVTGGERPFELEPEQDARAGIRAIGVGWDLERDPDGHAVLDVREDSPARAAGVRSGDRLVEVLGGVPGLPPRNQLAIQVQNGEPLRLRVAGEEGTRVVEVRPGTRDETNPPLVGIGSPSNHVFDVRDTPLVAASGIRRDDRLLRVQGVAVRQIGDLRRALTEHPGPLVIDVRRGEDELRLEGPELSRAQALELADSLAVKQDSDSTEIVVQPGRPADLAGLRTGDRVRKIDGTDVASFLEIQELVARASSEERAAVFEVTRTGAADGVPVFLTIAATPEARPILDYGLSMRQKRYVYRADSVVQAIGFGAYCSWKFLQDSWLTLKRMMTRDLSAKNLGGIITIGAVSYSFAEAGWPKLLFFLCMLSINLAFLNVLPIPVLDGGHLFFLIVEKVKGSPVSERVLGYSQMVGVVLILSLMVYVTYNDLVRWVFRS